MDLILGAPKNPFINLKQFLKQYKNALRSSPYDFPSVYFNIQEALHLSHYPEVFRQLEETCSPALLDSSDDPQVIDIEPGYSEVPRSAKYPIEDDGTLETVINLKKFKDKSRRNPFQRSTDIYKTVKLPELSEEEEKALFEYQPGEELKIYIRVYRPPRVTHVGRKIQAPVFSQEFECLGSNYLTELRDKIHCICNNKRFFDISKTPEASFPTKNEDPGYFFITDTFYNDCRNPLNADYSEHIRKWAKTAKGLERENFRTAKMEETRFIDLTVSLGYPSLYQHHGNCEHVFVFAQLEVITTPFIQVFPRQLYPLLRSYNCFNNRVCSTCAAQSFIYLVKDSNRQVFDPAYMCKECYMSYFYINGEKIGDFKSYRLINNNETQVDGTFGEDVKFMRSRDEVVSALCNVKSEKEEANDAIDDGANFFKCYVQIDKAVSNVKDDVRSPSSERSEMIDDLELTNVVNHVLFEE